ncbi:MAG: stage III sporulation protein AD [Clostridia bacterium]|nr:stage III sporulation protein AD [Clostridia bacterium]
MNGEIFKILGLCLVTAALCVILRPKNGEYALLVSVAAGLCVALIILSKIASPIAAIKAELEAYGVKTEYFSVALKAVGIGYVTTFIADACRDSGQVSLAAKAELAGKAAVFLLSVPLILSVLQTAVGFIK